MDNLGKQRLVINNMPDYDIQKMRETVPIIIDIGEGKTSTDIGTTQEEPEVVEQK